MLHNTSNLSIFIAKEWFYAILKFTEFREFNKINTAYFESENMKAGSFWFMGRIFKKNICRFFGFW